MQYEFLKSLIDFVLIGANREEERRQHEKEESANESSEIVTILGRSVGSHSIKGNNIRYSVDVP